MMLSFSLSCAHASQETVGRYITAKQSIPIEQKDVFSQQVHIHFDSTIKTVGEAANELLKLSGYAFNPSQNLALKQTLSKPLPLIQRELNNMTLKEALQVLMGEAFVFSKNSVNRTIDFKLNTPVFHRKKK